MPNSSLRRAGDGRTLLSLSRSAIAFESIHAQSLEEWNNVIMSRHAGFGRDPIKVQIGRKLPLPDRSFDAAYALHVFEHHHDHEVVPSLRELHRVLKPGATLRISTPDVETEARLYLATLARRGVRRAGVVRDDADLTCGERRVGLDPVDERGAPRRGRKLPLERHHGRALPRDHVERTKRLDVGKRSHVAGMLAFLERRQILWGRNQDYRRHNLGVYPK